MSLHGIAPGFITNYPTNNVSGDRSPERVLTLCLHGVDSRTNLSSSVVPGRMFNSCNFTYFVYMIAIFITLSQWHPFQPAAVEFCTAASVLRGIIWAIVGYPWWRHRMETFSALLAICAGNSPVPGEFHAQRPVTRRFDVFFDLRLNERLS